MPIPKIYLVKMFITLVLKIGIWYQSRKNRKNLEKGKPL